MVKIINCCYFKHSVNGLYKKKRILFVCPENGADFDKFFYTTKLCFMLLTICNYRNSSE